MQADDFRIVQAAVDAAGGEVDRAMLARRLEEYAARLARVRARGGAYEAVGFSPYMADLLLRLEAGGAVAAGTLH